MTRCDFYIFFALIMEVKIFCDSYRCGRRREMVCVRACAHVHAFVCVCCWGYGLEYRTTCNINACVCASTDVNRRCWCVTSKGMHAVGQPEVVVLLQCLPEEKRFPTDIFNHFIQIYWDAQTGKPCNQK